MRVAFVGVSHWHTRLYLQPALVGAGVRIVAVSDPDPAVADAYGRRLGCPSFTDGRDLVGTSKPDFVFVLGRHCDMAAEAMHLIERRIPFAIEKPCGLGENEVSRLAEAARDLGVFAAVPFVFRYSGFLDTVRRLAGKEDIPYLAFRLIAGPASRYLEAGCSWMLDPSRSGGGCTINLSVHFFDLCRLLFGERDLRVEGAVMSNDAWGYPVEDYSAVALRGASGTCVVETGYLFPAATGVFDLHFSAKVGHHYVAASEASLIRVFDENGASRAVEGTTTNMPHYPEFVTDVLRRSREGREPPADLRDMAAVMRLVGQAYELAGRGGALTARAGASADRDTGASRMERGGVA